MGDRLVLKLIFVPLAMIGINAAMVLAQTPQPASKPSSAPTAAVSKTDQSALEFLSKGLKDFEEGNNQAAQTVFADGLKLYGPPQTTSASVNDTAAHVALNHSAAITALRLKQLPAARTAVDRALAAKWTNDSLIFNGATIYTALKPSAIVAVRLLDPYMAAHPDADESWVNLYGLALQEATANATTSNDATLKSKLADDQKTLDALQAQLEKTQPGKHRWGSEWLDDDQWKEIQPKVDAANRNIQSLETKVAADQKAIQQAQQSAARQSSGGGGGGGRGGGRRGGGGRGGGAATPAQTPAQRAQMQLATDQRALGTAMANRPQPEWKVELVGVTPVVEMVKKEPVTPASSSSTKPAVRRGP